MKLHTEMSLHQWQDMYACFSWQIRYSLLAGANGADPDVLKLVDWHDTAEAARAVAADEI